VIGISSRTPEGQPNICPVCGKYLQIEPSSPAGDAPCPHCGCLLWYVATDAGLLFFEKAALIADRLIESQRLPRPRAANDDDEDTDFRPGERLRITEGKFESYEAEFKGIDSKTGGALLSINIFGRETPLELPLGFLVRA
jgi:hypothetical protein